MGDGATATSLWMPMGKCVTTTAAMSTTSPQMMLPLLSRRMLKPTVTMKLQATSCTPLAAPGGVLLHVIKSGRRRRHRPLHRRRHHHLHHQPFHPSHLLLKRAYQFLLRSHLRWHIHGAATRSQRQHSSCVLSLSKLKSGCSGRCHNASCCRDHRAMCT